MVYYIENLFIVQKCYYIDIYCKEIFLFHFYTKFEFYF